MGAGSACHRGARLSSSLAIGMPISPSRPKRRLGLKTDGPGALTPAEGRRHVVPARYLARRGRGGVSSARPTCVRTPVTLRTSAKAGRRASGAFTQGPSRSEASSHGRGVTGSARCRGPARGRTPPASASRWRGPRGCGPSRRGRTRPGLPTRTASSAPRLGPRGGRGRGRVGYGGRLERGPPVRPARCPVRTSCEVQFRSYVAALTTLGMKENGRVGASSWFSVPTIYRSCSGQ